MFYSHTFLARKGPLGTVWCAAHLQHKLKKSHYTATNIPTIVEHIMYPEVPIALRISGHLLLGVVRIYSKQVEYFCQDCNVLLIRIRKARASADVNLPENATQATLESVTLPDNFQLDALDLDYDFHSERFHDNHLRSEEEITLEDQILAGQDPYVVVTFNHEDVVRNSSFLEEYSSGLGTQPIEDDSNRHTIVDATDGDQYPGPIYQARIEWSSGDSNPHSFPEIEVMRDASLDYLPEDVPFWPDQMEDKTEPDTVLMEIMKEKGTPTLTMELVSGGPSIPPEQREEPVSAVSEQGPQIFDSHNAFGHVTLELAIRSTPPAEQHKVQPKEKARKKRQRYDELTVLSNRFMKRRIDESSDILRTRKTCPCNSLGMWKLNKRLKKDTVFIEPLLTGLCNALSDCYKKDFISSKPYLAFVEEACPSVSKASARMHDSDMEIERLRNYEIPARGNTLPEIIHSPNIVLSSPTRLMPSPTKGDEYTPAFGTDISLRSDQVETTIGTTLDMAASTRPLGSDMETPMTFFEDRLGVGNTCFSDIPVLGNSADGDLSFLAEDDNTPAAGSQGTPNNFIRKHSGTSEVERLSVRTRAVAQFLKNRSSITPVLESQSGDLSLNKILEGKRKKLCARMVFETLVLKNSGLVDMQQEEPFGDVALKVTPKLSKEQFSN